MLRKLVKNTLFAAVILLLGQVNIMGQTVGERHLNAIMNVYYWGTEQFIRHAHIGKDSKISQWTDEIAIVAPLKKLSKPKNETNAEDLRLQKSKIKEENWENDAVYQMLQ